MGWSLAGSIRVSAPKNQQILHTSETRVANGILGKKVRNYVYIPRPKFPFQITLPAESLLLEVVAVQPYNSQQTQKASRALLLGRLSGTGLGTGKRPPGDRGQFRGQVLQQSRLG